MVFEAKASMGFSNIRTAGESQAVSLLPWSAKLTTCFSFKHIAQLSSHYLWVFSPMISHHAT
jgi:hypothetical protein